MLLWTPALGLGFALLVLGSSLVSSGLGVKEAVTSIAWLDQRTHRVAVLARRTVFSGGVFGTELRFGSDSVVVPLPGSASGRVYLVDLDDGTLGGGFLPVRSPADELLVRSAAARQRLAIEREDGQLAVLNGLDARVLHLVYRDHDGAFYELRHGALDPGERAELDAAAPPGARLRMVPPPEEGGTSDWPPFTTAGFNAQTLGHLPPELPPGCYAAVLATSPFDDNGGVARSVTSQRHLLLGVLERER
jgi:hypothetical protein